MVLQGLLLPRITRSGGERKKLYTIYRGRRERGGPCARRVAVLTRTKSEQTAGLCKANCRGGKLSSPRRYILYITRVSLVCVCVCSCNVHGSAQRTGSVPRPPSQLLLASSHAYVCIYIPIYTRRRTYICARAGGWTDL